MNKRKGGDALKRQLRPFSVYRFSLVLWLLLLIFFLLVFSFPRWITFFYPLPHQEYVYKYAAQYNLDPYLVFAVIKAESRFKPEAESKRGARGLMQIMPDTARWIAEQMKMEEFEEEKLLDPETNIRMGCWYLSNLSGEFEGNTPVIVAAYNAGRGNVSQWLQLQIWDGEQKNSENIPFPETRNYVKTVLTDYEIYGIIYSRRNHTNSCKPTAGTSLVMKIQQF